MLSKNQKDLLDWANEKNAMCLTDKERKELGELSNKKANFLTAMFFYKRFKAKYKYNPIDWMFDGYYDEWVERFKKRRAISQMGFESLKVFKEIYEELKLEGYY